MSASLNTRILVRVLPLAAEAMDDPLLPQLERRGMSVTLGGLILVLGAAALLVWAAIRGVLPDVLVLLAILVIFVPLRWVTVEARRALFRARLLLHLNPRAGLEGGLPQIVRNADMAHIESLRLAPIDGDRAIGLLALMAVRRFDAPSWRGHVLVAVGMTILAGAVAHVWGDDGSGSRAWLELLPLLLVLGLFEYFDFRDSLLERAIREVIEMHNDLLVRLRAEGCGAAAAFGPLPSMPVRAIVLVRLGQGLAITAFLLGAFVVREAPLVMVALLVAVGLLFWETANGSRLRGIVAQFSAVASRFRTIWRVCWMEGW